MSRINVLWVIDHVCYDGDLHGGGRLYWNVLPRFDEGRFNVVPCMLRADDQIRRVFESSAVPVRILDKGKHDLTTLWALLRLIKEEKIDVMHLHCYGSSIFGRLAGLITGVPCILHDYDTAIYFPYPWYLWVADRALSSMTRRAVAASPMVRDYFINRRQIDESKISMAFHAIPSEKFVPVSKERVLKIKEGLGIDEGSRVVGTVTKLGPERGNRHLLRAASEVLRVMPDVVFLLAYSPTVFHRLPDRNYVDLSEAEKEDSVSDLEAQAKELDIEKNIRLIESPDNVGELIAAFDLFIAPFLGQRFSSVNVLEAMAIGKPVIATDIGEQREIVKNGVNGFLVPRWDVSGLATKILDVLTHPQELARLSRQARASAEQYGVDGYVRRLERWYEELAVKPAAGELKVGERSK